MPTTLRLRSVALGVVGAWAVLNGLLYAADFSMRYRAESAWFLFSAALIAAAIHTIATTRDTSDWPPPASNALTAGLIISLAAALALYWPMLRVGLLSDDFVLLARAQAGNLLDAQWAYVRPLPLAVWSLLSRVGAAAVPLHAFNIALHGLNAWLTGITATRFGLDKRSALIAATLFLVFPASVEPVVWAAGIFDVLFVTLALAASVTVTAQSMSTGTKTITIAALTLAALTTKETAVVLPALLAVAAYCSSLVTARRAVLPIAVSVGLVGLYLLVRVAVGFAAAPPSRVLSGYPLKEAFNRPFGTLGLPFHTRLLTAHVWIAFTFALYWPVLFVWSATRWPDYRRDATHVLGLSAWILLSVAPLATMLFIADDLEGSRYLYAASAGWSILIAVLVRSVPYHYRWFVIAPLVILFTIATRVHQTPWTGAARERDRVLDAYRSSGLACAPTATRGLPDDVQGAYVFRNGFAEAIAQLTPASAETAPCVLVWDGIRFSRE